MNKQTKILGTDWVINRKDKMIMFKVWKDIFQNSLRKFNFSIVIIEKLKMSFPGK